MTAVAEQDSAMLQVYHGQQPATTCSRGRQRNLRLDVLLLDGTQCQVSIDYRANGQDCLEKVCHSLGVLHEVNYFGLTYYGTKREELWLNMRNRLYKQLPAVAFGGVCRLNLRVKFYVPPHMMLLEETRHQVYLDVKNRLLDRQHWLLDGDLQPEGRESGSTRSIGSGGNNSSSSSSSRGSVCSDLNQDSSSSDEAPLLARLCALIVQADFSNSSAYCSIRHRIRQALSRLLDKHFDDYDKDFCELFNAAMKYHSTLTGLSPAAAEYRLLQAASTGLSMYGSHYHDAKDHMDSRLTVAVGPDAVWLCRQDGRTFSERYAYPRVQQVTISDRFLYLSISQENGNIREVGFRLATPKAANCLYRCVTETHSFFRCDTVRNNVATKTCRDMKGAFVSLLVERDLWSVRNFVFDVQLTAKEVHDKARRQVFKCLAAAQSASSAGQLKPEQELTKQECRSPDQTAVVLLDRIRRLEQSRLCQFCADSSLSVVFQPCGHMLACAECAGRVETCPVCRSSISGRLQCFVPWQ